MAIQDQDVRWSKHAQVVERIRSNPNSVKLTLVTARVMAKDPPTVQPCTASGGENKPQHTAQTAPSTPKTPKLHQRLFRLPTSSVAADVSVATTTTISSPVHPHLTTPHLAPDSSFSNAANRLANLVKQQTNDWTKSAFRRQASSKSVQNLPDAVALEKIQFTEEDDEISNRENQLFWQSLKNLKVPFTNTITLGRKFRKNVLKLSIFNSFSANHGSNDDSANDSSGTAQNKELQETATGCLPPPPPSTPNSKRAKLRLLRKQKKLNKLETEQANDSNQLLYKTI